MRAMKNDALDALTLWEFPPEDFSHWRASFRTPLIPTRNIRCGSAARNAWLSEWASAVRVQLTIEEMLAELAAGGSKHARESGSHHRPGCGVSADKWDL